MNIAKKIAALRKKIGLSQKDFAAELKTTQKVVSDYETGKSKPPLQRLPLIAKILGVTVDTILNTEDLPVYPENKRIHGNSRLAKIYELLDRDWTPEEERAILSHLRGLIALKNKSDSTD